MLHIHNVLHVLGLLVFGLGVSLLAPLAVSIGYWDGAQLALLTSTLAAMGAGVLLWSLTKRRVSTEINVREGIAVVGVGWLLISAFAALPYYLWARALPAPHELQSFASCYFESASGLTTTGASVLGSAGSTVEAMPKGLLFWRALTHWLGGMGIIVLAVALLPLVGYGVMQLFKAESSGVNRDKVAPRVQDTAKRLWFVYVVFTLAQILLLCASSEMGLFDAACHSFATLATGGFSTKDTSVILYGPYVQWVITAFMFLGGANFTLHYHAMRTGKLSTYWRSDEFRFYLLIVAVSSLAIAFHLHAASPDPTIEKSARDATFQVVSIMTTTGFSSADYELWPWVCQMILFMLLVCGACAGSTAGGIKVVRHLLLLRAILAELKRMVHPRAVFPVRLNGAPVSRQVLAAVHTFVLLYLLLAAVGALLLTLCPRDPTMPIDMITAISGSLSCLGNVGPGFGRVGAIENYSVYSPTGLWVLSGLMLAGRLELYTVVVLLTPRFWRRR